jgi:hypothetical protein
VKRQNLQDSKTDALFQALEARTRTLPIDDTMLYLIQAYEMGVYSIPMSNDALSTFVQRIQDDPSKYQLIQDPQGQQPRVSRWHVIRSLFIPLSPPVVSDSAIPQEEITAPIATPIRFDPVAPPATHKQDPPQPLHVPHQDLLHRLVDPEDPPPTPIDPFRSVAQPVKSIDRFASHDGARIKQENGPTKREDRNVKAEWKQRDDGHAKTEGVKREHDPEMPPLEPDPSVSNSRSGLKREPSVITVKQEY